MSKLSELKEMVKTLFENAKEKGAIEEIAKINSKIEEAEAEHKELTDSNESLLKAYKEAVKHTSFKEAPKSEIPAGGELPSVEEALKTFLAEHKES